MLDSAAMKTPNRPDALPLPTIRRYPAYLRSVRARLSRGETSVSSAALAAELGLDPAVARRVGLLHDVGKALDETASGPHALAGADFLRKCGEPKEVTDGVAGHHGETEEVTLYATLASGRIQPQRIEEVVESVRQNWDARLLEIGSEAAAEADVDAMATAMVDMLGRIFLGEKVKPVTIPCTLAP